MTGKSEDPHSIGDVLDSLNELAEEEDQVEFADVLHKFGARSFAPVMLVLALIEETPIGAIPGVPTFVALCIAVIAAQLLAGRRHIWVPQWIARRSVSSDKLVKATDKLDGIAHKLDKFSKGRLQRLTRGPALRVAAALILLLCMAVPPLEVVPWASSGPMIAIAIISLAILVRDGLAMLIAWVLAAGVAGGIAYYFLFSGQSGGGGFLPF